MNPLLALPLGADFHGVEYSGNSRRGEDLFFVHTQDTPSSPLFGPVGHDTTLDHLLPQRQIVLILTRLDGPPDAKFP